jgi:hypothetical protein
MLILGVFFIFIVPIQELISCFLRLIFHFPDLRRRADFLLFDSFSVFDASTERLISSFLDLHQRTNPLLLSAHFAFFKINFSPFLRPINLPFPLKILHSFYFIPRHKGKFPFACSIINHGKSHFRDGFGRLWTVRISRIWPMPLGSFS